MAANVVIDFDSLPTSTFNTAPLTTNGFTFTVNTGHYDIFSGSTGNLFNIDDVGGFSSVTVTYSGGLFSLNSLDIDELDQPGGLTFTDSNTATFTPVTTGTQSPPLGFQNISSFTFAQNAGGFYAVDNLNLTVSAVPLPAAAPMFGAAVLALGLAGYGMKRRKVASAA